MQILKNTFFLYRRCFLQLIAIYLVGWLVRYGIVQLAVAIAVKHGTIWGNFLLPLSPLTMLLTYLGMFWVLRPYIFPESTEIGVQTFLNTVLQTILPTFAIFVLWKLHLHDAWEFQHQAVSQITTQHSTEILSNGETEETARAEAARLTESNGAVLTAIVALLLIVRRILSYIATRLPKWTMLPRLYVESTWVYIFFSASAAAIFASPRWVSERKIVVWYREQKKIIFEHLGPIADAIEWITNHTAGMAQAILAPLSWFVIAGLAYSHESSSTWTGASKAVLGRTYFDRMSRMAQKPAALIQSRLRALPAVLRSRSDEVRSSILGTFDHVRDALRLVLQLGLPPVSFYIALFAILVLLYPTDVFFSPQVSDGVLWRGFTHFFGPHEFSWWKVHESSIRLTIGAAIEPIRICLVGGMYWCCIQQSDQLISNSTDTTLSGDSLKETTIPLRTVSDGTVVINTNSPPSRS